MFQSFTASAETTEPTSADRTALGHMNRGHIGWDSTAKTAPLDGQSNDLGLSRRVEPCRERGTKYAVLRGRMFSRNGHVISPDGADETQLSRAECRSLLRDLGRSMVQWTDDVRYTEEESAWYYVVCRKFQPIEDLTSKKRSQIRRGLRNCNVRRISVQELAVTISPPADQNDRAWAVNLQPFSFVIVADLSAGDLPGTQCI